MSDTTQIPTDDAEEAPLAIASHSHHVLLQTMQLFGTKDFQEGLASSMEQPPPEFRGR